MIEFRKALSDYLKTIHSRVYYQEAPELATFPYIVYDIPSALYDGEYTDQITLDIDGWDLNTLGDTTAIETLMDNINALDKKVLEGPGMTATCYLDNRMALTDPDKNIKHRKYIYSVRVIRRS